MYGFARNGKQTWGKLGAVSAGLLISSAALAQAAPQAPAEQWPQATLRAQASAQVQQDTVRITLAQEVSNASQQAVSKALTTVLDQVMSQARGVQGVKASSGNYRVWPHTGKDGKITNWRGRAEIFLESRDFGAASELASRLSERMPIADIAFSVSNEARSKAEADLLSSAAASFRDRAQALATSFGYGAFEIRNIELSGEGAVYQPMPRMGMAAMSMAAEKADVPLEADTETVSLSIYGSVFLLQKK